jgi:hypothetical protein
VKIKRKPSSVDLPEPASLKTLPPMIPVPTYIAGDDSYNLFTASGRYDENENEDGINKSVFKWATFNPNDCGFLGPYAWYIYLFAWPRQISQSRTG